MDNPSASQRAALHAGLRQMIGLRQNPGYESILENGVMVAREVLALVV